MYTTRIAKHDELFISILPIYLGMCPSVPTHIRSYMSKLRLLLKTDDKLTSYVYSESRACPVAGVQNWPQGVEEVGLIVCPFRNVTGGSEPGFSRNT